MIALADLLTFLLYFSESRTKSPKFPNFHFPKFVVIYVCVLLCKSKVFWSIMAMIVKIEQDDNYF